LVWLLEEDSIAANFVQELCRLRRSLRDLGFRLEMAHFHTAVTVYFRRAGVRIWHSKNSGSCAAGSAHGDENSSRARSSIGEWNDLQLRDEK
jgi:hypothetical protein